MWQVNCKKVFADVAKESQDKIILALSPMTSMLIRDTKKRDIQRSEDYMKTEVKTGVTQT